MNRERIYRAVGGVLVAFVALAMAMAMAACGSDPYRGPEPPDPPVNNTLTGVNKWIYDDLKDWYYWNAEVKATAPPSNKLSYDEFLTQSVLALKNARDTSENPPTIDGGYDYANGRFTPTGIPYSYIERLATATRASGSEKLSFGFDVQAFQKRNSTVVEMLVTWVQPNSPAEEAGLKRGVWLTRYNGAVIHGGAGAEYEQFWYRLHRFQGGTSMIVADKDGNEYDLTAETIRNTPILYHDVFDSPVQNRRVAYLVYNAFETGEMRGQWGEFDNDLREVFRDFKARGAQELVLDLRYNHGGAISSCQLLASLAANVGPSQIFCRLLYNKDIAVADGFANPRSYFFLNEDASLKLNKIYVLAGENSASASEMFINSLQAKAVGIDIVHIGERTEGKNVGMNLREHKEGGYTYNMWPISFKIMNADSFCDYAGGLKPDLAKNEFWEVQNTGGTGEIFEFGNQAERLLGSALRMIDGGVVSPDADAVTRARGERAAEPVTRELVKQPHDPTRGGARIYERPHPVAL